MARPPRPWYAHGAWYSDFGRRNRVLIRGPRNADTKRLAKKELLRLREEAKLLKGHSGEFTPYAAVVEQFLGTYVRRPACSDCSNQLHWFLGGSPLAKTERTRPVMKLLENRPSGGRFGFACKNWPIGRINAELVEEYLRKRAAAGLTGYHAFVALRTMLNWAKKKGYIRSHDLDNVDHDLRRRGRRE